MFGLDMEMAFKVDESFENVVKAWNFVIDLVKRIPFPTPTCSRSESIELVQKFTGADREDRFFFWQRIDVRRGREEPFPLESHDGDAVRQSIGDDGLECL